MTVVTAGGILALSAFLLAVALCGLTRRVAPRVGLIDRPGGRKAHARPTPLGGGVAIWLTMALVLGAGAMAIELGQSFLPPSLAEHIGGLRERAGTMVVVFALATVVMAMGLADDRFGLGWALRLAVQVALAAGLVLAGVRITLFPPLSHSPALTAVLTVVWVVGLTNSFNFLDNMDGLAAGVGLIAAALFAGAQWAVGSLFVPAVLLVLVGALAGFLVHNANPARLFMGDAGSNFLGFLLGALTVLGTFTREGYSRFAVLTPLLVMAVPLYDTASVLLIRVWEGRSPFQPDRCHFSHRLVERGLTPRRAVWTIDLVTLACGLGALLLHRPGTDAPMAAVVVGQTVCLLGVVAILEVSTSRPERRDAQARQPPPPTTPTPT